MKKHFFAYICMCTLLVFHLAAQTYKITDCEITIESSSFGLGTTKPYAVEKNYPLDKKTEFTQEQLQTYLDDYKKSLESSRFFEEIEVGYETRISIPSDSINGEPATSESPAASEVIVKIRLKDSKHLLAMPYATFKHDTVAAEITPKIKAKDTNFLGSLNPLSVDINVNIKKQENDDSWYVEPGLNLSYDYPFKAGILDATWVNDYTLTYTVGNESPEWEAKTGLKLELPFDRISFVWEAYQYFFRDFDYEEYGDDLYFKEEFQFSTPLILYRLSNYTNIVYTPALNFSWNWDGNYINEENDDLSSPNLNFKNTLENSRVIWENNFRKGYDFALGANLLYNLQRNDFAPNISAEAKFYVPFTLSDRNFLNRIGINTDLYAFMYFDLPGNGYFYGNEIGERLRGIADESFFGNEKPDYTTSSAFVLNLDIPINIVHTNFKKQLVNLDMQLVPFFDFAVYKDRSKTGSQAQTALCSGLEMLVFPQKWQSFIIRASLGFDLKGAFADNQENILKRLWHNKEISVGLGLLY